jgi:hypothetical protein
LGDQGLRYIIQDTESLEIVTQGLIPAHGPCPRCLQVANTADDLVDYLLTGHHYAQRMLTSAIIAAYTIPQEEKYEMMRQGLIPPPLPVLPDNLAGWATFDLSDDMFKVRSKLKRLMHI